MFVRKIGIDLGTSTTQVYVRGAGVVVDEPTVAAMDEEGSLRAMGRAALEPAEHGLASFQLVRPVRGGAIYDRRLVQLILQQLMDRASGRHRLVRPEVTICVPASATRDERRALIDATIAAGARQAWLIEAPLAAALGLGLPVAESRPYGICDLGGGLVQTAVLSLSGVAASQVLPSGGEELDSMLADDLQDRLGIAVSAAEAESLKMTIGAAMPLAEPLRTYLRGVTVTTDDLTEAVRAWLDRVVETVLWVIDQSPRGLAVQVRERGFFLTGGGALMRGVASYLTDRTGISFAVGNDPRTCAVRGSRGAMGGFHAVHRRHLYLGGG